MLQAAQTVPPAELVEELDVLCGELRDAARCDAAYGIAHCVHATYGTHGYSTVVLIYG